MTRGAAVLGAVLLCALIAVTAASVLLRFFVGQPLPGDYEIVEIGAGIAIFAAFPLCKLERANIAVDIFLQRVRPRSRRMIEIAIELLFAASLAVLSWRMVIGGLGALEGGESTMILHIGQWYGYVVCAAFLALAAVVGLCQLRSAAGSTRRDRD